MKALFRTYSLAWLTLLLFSQAQSAFAQCTSPTPYQGAAANNSGIAQTLTTCAFGGEYSPYSNVIAGNTYSFTATGGAGNYITIRQTDGTGTFVTAGFSPLTGVVSPISGTLAVIVHTTAACGTESVCQTITANCTSCTPPPPPANDNCAGALSVAVNPDLNCTSVTMGTVASATASTGPTSSCGTYDDDVWFSFVATASTHLIELLNITGSTSDLTHQVLSSCGAATSLVCSDPNTSTASALTPGQTYFIRVASWTSTGGQTSSFSVCVKTPPPPPANDNCAGAISLTVNADFACGVATAGTTISATQSTETAPSCSATGVNDDVWYSFTATGAAHQVRITGATNTTAVAVYTGSCGALTQITSACASTSAGTANLNLTGLTAGTTYRVRVYTTSTVVGTAANFTICVGTPPPPPANDNCAGALSVAVNPDLSCTSVTMGTVTSATASTGPTSSCGTYDDDVWFSFVATASTHLIELLNITGSTSDLTHQVLSSCGAATALVCSDPNTSTASALTPGQTYFIRVASWTSTAGQTSSFSVCVKTLPPPPANDECAGATPLTVGASCSFTQYTTAGATGSVGPPAPGCASYSGGDVWFSVVVPSTGRLILDSNTGVVSDGGMAIYSGNCGSLTLIECDDDDSVNGLMPFIDRSGLTPGSTVYVRFWEFGNDNPGTFSICAWAPAPPCTAPGTPSASNVSTTSATLSWAAAVGATSYRYSSGTAGHVCGTGSLTTAGTSVNLTGLIPNTTYTFCVRTDDCGGGSASSYVSTTFTTAPLPNDACAGAITVTCGSTINGSTIGASSDAAVGSCGIGTGGTPGNGIWYKLVGNGAQVTASLCGSAYDTKIHVYTGSCAGLTCLVSNDDNVAACGAGSTRSQVIFNANVGTDYYILVNGFSSTTGAFSLNLTCLCGPALGAPWTVTNIGPSNGGAIENVCDGTIDVKATNYGSPSNDVQTYAWQQLCGNGFIKAKVENVINGGWGGIMFRENNAGGSKKVALRTQLNSTVIRDLRAATNGFAQSQQFPRPNTPQWLRLTRTGNVFVGETSIDGVNWDFTFNVNLVLPSCIEVGLFAQSINVNTTTTAVFSNIMGVATTPPVIPLVDGNSNNDVVEAQELLSLFPNPATDEINVKMEAFYGKNVTISVQNQLGQVMLQRDIDEVQDATERIELTNLPSGIYTLTLRTAGQAPVSKQFMVGQIRP